ncbi:polysaccharide deacetylase family protein [Helicobacter mesocricetorum]|uniref:polysaccharide deacetylase family protein n=1 Tax=Helicobacter mesocricetorum TaxID=87012 RepID=UPI000CF1AFCE|nr:polysaccharide deacetylase family protein [Helicobacter mesocricetorum]
MNYPICILTLHHIHPFEDWLSVSPQLLSKALINTKQKGYNFISYEKFIEILQSGKNPSKKQVLLSIDDGYFDVYKYGFPVLKELKIPSVCFLITDTIQERRQKEPVFKPHKEIDYVSDVEYFLTAEEIFAMREWMAFDSHTASHYNCNTQNKESLEFELHTSKHKIAELFPQKDIFGFCYPRGKFNTLSQEVLRECGYSFAFSTIEGGVCVESCDPFAIKRICISSTSPKRGEIDYLKRLNAKLFIYSTPILGSLKSKFKARK